MTDTPNWPRIENHIKNLVDVLHEELDWFSDEELKNSPRRITDFYHEWWSHNNFNFTTFERKTDQLVVLKDITFFSMCSHHMLPFFGKVHIGYLPGGRICGVSKLARVVRKVASRPQIQEQMTEEIADLLYGMLKPRGVMVIVHGAHTCMIGRGVREPNSLMVTSAIRGKFQGNAQLKEEFMRLI